MLKMLRADLYKLFKSKILLVLFILMLCSTIIEPLSWMGPQNLNNYSVYSILRSGTALQEFIWLLIVPFAAKDFSSGYVKNFFPSYTKRDKLFYVLSKVAVIFAFCLLYYLVKFAVNVFFVYIANPEDWMMYDPAENTFTIGYFYFAYIAGMLNAVAVSSVITVICMLTKKEIFAFLVSLVCIFLSAFVCRMIDNEVGERYFIEVYTLFAQYNALYYSSAEQIAVMLGISVFYIVLSVIVGYVILTRRSR